MNHTRRLHAALACNWLAIAWHCHRKGHDWDVRRICWCRRQAHCRYCGVWRGDILVSEPGRPTCNFHGQWKVTR